VIRICQQDSDWAAQEYLCRRLGVSFSHTNENEKDFGTVKVMVSFLLRKPWLCYRLIPAINEYWECKYYIAVLQKDAVNIRTDINDGIVNYMLNQAWQDLIRESPVDWPELMGLVSQKLMHLRYHDEIHQWEAEEDSTSDNIFSD